MGNFFNKFGIKKNLAPIRIPVLEITALSCSLKFLIVLKYSLISNEPRLLKTLKTIALTSEGIFSSIGSLIGLSTSAISLSIHSCNFLIINNFFSESTNSELRASAFGEYIFIPFSNLPIGSSPQ